MPRTASIVACYFVLGLCALSPAALAQPLDLSPDEQLGKSIFFDLNLSINQNQSCASCHGSEVGFTGPDSVINDAGAVYEGSIAGRFGARKPPTASYATLSPIFFQDKKGLFVGGNFWDGRATGELLGNPAADQALGPFVNPVEQALPDSACVVYRVCNPAVPGDYPISFEQVWGADTCAISWPADVETLCATPGTGLSLTPQDRALSDENYGRIGLVVATYEDSAEVNAFSSKFDRAFGGKGKNGPKVKLSKQEQLGYALFRGKGKCARCHPANGKLPLLTDFTFDNLGIPQNPDNPAGVAPDFVDPGLGGFLESASYPEEVYLAEWGKHKVPTLRNVAKGSCETEPDNPVCVIKAFGHNGYFKSLRDIVHFYNTRDVLDRCADRPDAEPGVNCWPDPEVAMNVNQDELGDLGLSAAEEDAIVAFLATLSDGWAP